jgi:hypothetical protein
MTIFLLCLHVYAAYVIGLHARRRGRRFIVWTALTLIPYGVLVTCPLLFILPKCNGIPAIEGKS